MNEEYLQGLHNYLGIEDDFEVWKDSIVDNEEYLKGLHAYLGVEDDFEVWNDQVFNQGLEAEVVPIQQDEVIFDENNGSSNDTFNIDTVDDTFKEDSVGTSGRFSGRDIATPFSENVRQGNEKKYIVDGLEVPRGFLKKNLYEDDFVEKLQNNQIKLDIQNDEELQDLADRQKNSGSAWSDVYESLESGASLLMQGIIGAETYLSDGLELLTGVEEAGNGLVLNAAAPVLGGFISSIPKDVRNSISKALIDRVEENEFKTRATEGDFIDEIGRGNFSRAAKMGLNTTMQSAPLMLASIAAAYASGGASTMVQALAGATAMTALITPAEYVQGLVSDDPNIQKLTKGEKFFRGTARGLAEGIPEGLMSPIGLSGGKVLLQGLKKLVKKASVEVGENAAVNLAKSLGKETALDMAKAFGLGVAAEGVTEFSTSLAQDFTDDFLGVHNLGFEKYLRRGLNAGALGVFMGGIMQTSGSATRKTFDLLPLRNKKLYQGSITDIRKRQELGTISKEEGDRIINDIEEYRSALEKTDSKLNDKQQNKIANLIYERNILEENIKKLDPNQQSVKDDKARVDNINKEISEISATDAVNVDLAAKGAKVRKNIVDIKTKDTIEFAETQGEKLNKKVYIVETDLSTGETGNQKAQKIFDEYVKENPGTKEEIVENADGYRIGDIVVLNKDIMQQTGALDVGSHEIFHVVVDDYFEGLDIEARRKLIKDFKNLLSDEQRSAVEERINKNYSDIDTETSIEWFNAFSDAIQGDKITFDEGIGDKILNFVQEILRKVGVKKEFSNARQAYNFMKDFSKSVSKGELSERALKLSKSSESKASDLKASKTKENKEIKEIFDEFTGPAENRKFKSKEEFKSSPEYFKALEEIEQSNTLDASIRNIVGKSYLDMNPGFIKEVKEKISDKFKSEYDASKNSLFGWLTGKNISGQPLINRAAGDIQIKRGKKPSTVSADKKIGGEESRVTIGETLVSDEISPEDYTDMMLAQDKLKKIKPQQSKIAKKIDLTKNEINLVKRDITNFLRKSDRPAMTDPKKFFKAFVDYMSTATGNRLYDKLSAPKDGLLSTKNRKAFIESIAEDLIALNKVDPSVMRRSKWTPFYELEIKRMNPTQTQKAIDEGRVPSTVNLKAGNDLFKTLDPSTKEVVDYLMGIRPDVLKRKMPKFLAEVIAKNEFNDIVNNSKQPVYDTKGDLTDRTIDLSENITEKEITRGAPQVKEKIARPKGVKFSNTAVQTALASDLSFENYIQDKSMWRKLAKELNMTSYNFNNSQDRVDFIKNEMPRLVKILPKVFFQKSPGTFAATPKSKYKTITLPNGKKKSIKTGEKTWGLPFASKTGVGGLDEWLVNFEKSDEFEGYGKPFVNEDGKPMSRETMQKGLVRVGQTGSATTKFNKDFGNNEFVEQVKIKELILKQFFERTQDSDKNTKQSILGILQGTSFHQAHFIRTICPITFRQLNMVGKTVEEHALGASLLAKWGMILAKDGLVNDNFTGVTKNFVQGPIEKTNDDKVNRKELGMKTGPKKEDLFQTLIGEYDWAIRYASVPDFNLNTIQILDNNYNKVMLTDFYNVGVDAKYKNNPDVIAFQNSLIVDQIANGLDSKAAKELLNEYLKLVPQKTKAGKFSKSVLSESKVLNLEGDLSMQELLGKAASIDEALSIARDINAPVKKIRVFDFDDTLAITKSNVLFTAPDGTEGSLTAEKFAMDGARLLEEGYSFDFTEFDKVTKGKPGPLLDLAKKIQEARGTEDVFVLTARAPQAAIAIKEFLKSQGLDIPLKNITGLGKSTGEAKANWMIDKAAEGYNDFYFADDALQNVEAVRQSMNMLDVKSKAQLVRKNEVKFSKTSSKKLNFKTDEAGNIKTTFEIAGKKYNFNLDARDSKGSFDVEFNLGGRIDITGTGDAVKVIRTVYNGLLDAINQNNKINKIEFSSLKSEPSRVRLYTTLMDRVAKKLGWETDVWESNNFIAPENSSYDFEITKPRKKQVAPVEKVLDVVDVKSKVQKAKFSKSKDLSSDFNKLIEESTGIGAEKVFSDVKAKLRGGDKKGQRFFIPPSAEDMLGLVYTTLGKGKKGEAHMKFYQENLFDPYTRAMDNLSTDRVNLMADFKALKKELNVPKDLQKTTKSGFTNEQAVRVYLWNKAGEQIPGLSKADLKELSDIVENDPKLKVFADQIISITKGDGYSVPKDAWALGTITTDLIDILNTTKRGKYLESWNQNIDLIYSKDNLNKLEAAYGKKYRDAIENSLGRMKSGSNRLAGGNKLSNDVLDYINNSTAVTMFVNVRSALLQTLSSANFINWSFNNPLMAGKAFANQPQFWKDFTMLMNSDYLVDRRNGLKLNINESEIANAAKTSKNKAKAALNYILEKGYLPTKYADSFAIASGGATFYRNRVNDLIKNEGLSKSEAEIRAMKEFRAESEKSQQSSDPSKISSQQAGYLGRIILQYVNTPMQYARLQKRDVQDMVNRRAMPGKTLAQSNRTRLSRIAYYAFIQNLMFNALQQAVFAIGFGDDGLDDKDEKKITKTLNGMLDSSLRGLGLAGVTVQVLKNLGIDIYERSKRKRPEYTDSYLKLLEFSPAIKSKLSRFRGAAYPFDSKKRRAEVFEKGFSLDNPAYESMAKVVTATTNVPLDRLFGKVNNLKAAADEDTEAWQSLAMILGWPEWQVKDKKSLTKKPLETDVDVKKESKSPRFSNSKYRSKNIKKPKQKQSNRFSGRN